MPFPFPDRAYTSEDKDVRDMILFVHRYATEERERERDYSNKKRKGCIHLQTCIAQINAMKNSAKLLIETIQGTG